MNFQPHRSFSAWRERKTSLSLVEQPTVIAWKGAEKKFSARQHGTSKHELRSHSGESDHQAILTAGQISGHDPLSAHKAKFQRRILIGNGALVSCALRASARQYAHHAFPLFRATEATQ